MNKYQNIVGKINYWLFLIVVFLLPFPQTFLRYACVIWIFSWLLEGRWISKPKSIKENKMALPFILFGLWFLWKFISILWAPDMIAWRWQMERYLTFALIVPIGIWGLNTNYNWVQAGKTLIIGSIASSFFYISIMGILFHYPELVSNYSFGDEWNYNITKWWSFFIENISHIKHRLFLCSIALFSMVLAIQLWKDKKWLLAIILPLLFIPIILTGSRQSIITSTALLVIGVILAIPKPYRLRYGIAILLVGIFISGGLLQLHPRMQNFDFSKITEMRNISYDHDIRFNIWGSALQHPTDYLWCGLGAGQSSTYLANQYHHVGFEYYALKRYHPHNQYLEELMEIGVFGMTLFILAWLSISFYSKERGRHTAILFTTLFMLNMFTDCMFGKFCGIALWAVGLIFIFLQSNSQRNEQTAGNTQTH